MKHFTILTFISFLFLNSGAQNLCDTYDSWPASDINGNPNQNSWCEWCIDYENNNFQNFNSTGAAWGDPDEMCDCCSSTTTESYNCTADGCVDPGDGTGTYVALSDCEPMCVLNNCDTYDSWPASDMNGNPNQNSWCEWCFDYAAASFQNFNSTGSTWGDPDEMCSCCDNWTFSLEDLDESKVIIYPNPSRGEISVSLENNNPFNIEIRNSLGQLIYHEDLHNPSSLKNINISEKGPGMYIFNLRTLNETYTAKILIK